MSLANQINWPVGKSYIAAGFVKWIEAAGARAVPIRSIIECPEMLQFFVLHFCLVSCRFYATDAELKRLFKSINGIIFPVRCVTGTIEAHFACARSVVSIHNIMVWISQGGLTWLWRDAPYVVAAKKIFNMAVAANKKGDVFPVRSLIASIQPNIIDNVYTINCRSGGPALASSSFTCCPQTSAVMCC